MIQVWVDGLIAEKKSYHIIYDNGNDDVDGNLPC